MASHRDAVQQLLTDLYKQHGYVTAEMVLEAAADPECPAHDAFTWDDAKAAHQHRLKEAREYIRNIRIVIEERKERLVHVKIQPDEKARPDSKEGYYRTIGDVWKNPLELRSALAELAAKIQALQAAYDEVLECAKKENRPDVAAIIAELAAATMVWRNALNRLH